MKGIKEWGKFEEVESGNGLMKMDILGWELKRIGPSENFASVRGEFGGKREGTRMRQENGRTLVVRAREIGR